MYIKDNQIKETIPATIEDGYIVFETNHLSHYGIIATENETGIKNPKTNDDILVYIVIGILSIIGFFLSIIIYRKKQLN